MNQPSDGGYACPRCTVGRCLPSAATFCDLLGDDLLTVPNMPAFICDVCHFAEFEQDALEALWHALYADNAKDDYQPIAPGKRNPTYRE